MDQTWFFCSPKKMSSRRRFCGTAPLDLPKSTALAEVIANIAHLSDLRARPYMPSCRAGGVPTASDEARLVSAIFVKLMSFARKYWTWKINRLEFAPVICESGRQKWRSWAMRG
jgi:hypothetical protein